MRELVRELGREHTVVLSTHILSEVEACATRVLLIHRGKIVAEGPTDEIRSMCGARAVDFGVRSEPGLADRVLRGTPGVVGVAGLENAAMGTVGATGGVLVTLRATLAELPDEERARTIEACVAALVAAGVGVHEVRAARGSLEDVFASLTQEVPAGVGTS